jgi:hypothetical protein
MLPAPTELNPPPYLLIMELENIAPIKKAAIMIKKQKINPMIDKNFAHLAVSPR